MLGEIKGDTKRCSSCREEIPLSSFHRDRTRKDGYKSSCKECRSSGASSEHQAVAVEPGKTAKDLENLARSKAIKIVLESHWDEFQTVLKRSRKDYGLHLSWKRLD